VYGSKLKKRAERRDFTFTRLYYNFSKISVFTITAVAKDIEDKQIRIIG